CRVGSQKREFFYCPDEAIYPRDRGQIILEWGQIIRKVTDQRRSAITTGPAGSDKPLYVNKTDDNRARGRSRATAIRARSGRWQARATGRYSEGPASCASARTGRLVDVLVRRRAGGS